jgi:hypothetical protein
MFPQDTALDLYPVRVGFEPLPSSLEPMQALLLFRFPTLSYCAYDQNDYHHRSEHQQEQGTNSPSDPLHPRRRLQLMRKLLLIVIHCHSIQLVLPALTGHCMTT